MIVKEAITWAKEMIMMGKAPIENIGHDVSTTAFFDSSTGETRSLYIDEIVEVLEYFGHKQTKFNNQ
jgi:hypothetical protein